MRRVYGDASLPLVDCINRKIGKYRVRWDVQPYYDEQGEERGVSFLEVEFLHRPSLDEIKQSILTKINEEIDEKIVGGFEWQGQSVWLSSENQFNYKAAYDLAVQSGGATLPVVFKFGTTESPTYHEFTTLEELSDFYTKAMKHISDTLAEGWRAKDEFDWSVYKEWQP